MSPDDQRHGTTRGAAAGCKDLCCRRAMARYEKRRRLNAIQGTAFAIPALGAQRRIQALMALGWTTTDIATMAGWSHRNRVGQILRGQKGKPCRWIERSTFDKIATLYAELSMTLPEQDGPRRRSRARALSLGYAPPLAWDDIDNDRAPRHCRTFDPVDHVVVERILTGEFALPSTADERREVVRRWAGSDAELERKTGWNVPRIRREMRAAA